MNGTAIAMQPGATRRDFLLAGGAAAAVALLPKRVWAATQSTATDQGNMTMAYITTTDGTEIF
jgi:hypothetical protein